MLQIFCIQKNKIMNDTFDKLFDEEKEDIGYYQDVAMQYLTEIEDLKEKLSDCSERLKTNHTMHVVQKEREEHYERTIANLQAELRIRRNAEFSQNFNPLELENRVKGFTDHIRNDIESFQKTGKFDGIDRSINEVRDIFNVFLAELNRLNANNRDVFGTLETLMRLDVGFFGFCCELGYIPIF